MFDAMEPIGLDTLKATKRLRAAGFDATQAEALVTVFGGPVPGNIASKQDIRDLRVEVRDLRTELKADIDGLRTEFKADIDALREESAGMRKDIAQLGREMAELRLAVRGHATKAQMYRLLLLHATVVVGLIVGLQQLF